MAWDKKQLLLSSSLLLFSVKGEVYSKGDGYDVEWEWGLLLSQSESAGISRRLFSSGCCRGSITPLKVRRT